MAKLRKMLGSIESQECKELMALIETQSKKTLAAWAADYAKNQYLGIYEEYAKKCTDDSSICRGMAYGIDICTGYLNGERKLDEAKVVIREMRQTAQNCTDQPVMQAAARAISTACATVQTPTNALGFLFYGAATVAYHELGIEETQEAYEIVATRELKRAYASLQAAAVPDEKKPAKIKWGC